MMHNHHDSDSNSSIDSTESGERMMFRALQDDLLAFDNIEDHTEMIKDYINDLSEKYDVVGLHMDVLTFILKKIREELELRKKDREVAKAKQTAKQARREKKKKKKKEAMTKDSKTRR
jgi:hypothetical protein